MADVNVTILGLERLGTSFGLALKRYMTNKEAHHTFTITGSDARGYNSKTAKEAGAIDKVENNPAKAVKGAHIVLMTAPYNQVEELYQIIGYDLMPGAVVLDTSPLKKPSIKWAADTLPHTPEVAAYMVGLTPVLNPEVLYAIDNEVETARVDLFDNGVFLLAPAADCPAEAVELASEVTRIVGSNPHFVDVYEHDGFAAAMEGLPVVVSVALFNALYRSNGWSDIQRSANPTFGAVMSPLRFQHPDAMWALLHYNRELTAHHLTALIDNLTQLRDGLLTDEDGLGVEALVVEGASQYQEWEGHRLANRWDKGEDDHMPKGGMMSNMGGMLLGRFGRKGDDKDD